MKAAKKADCRYRIYIVHYFQKSLNLPQCNLKRIGKVSVHNNDMTYCS